MSKNDGKALEKEVADLVESLLQSGELPYRPELCRFKAKAKYYSRNREAEVDFENVLEVYVKDNYDNDNAKPTHVVIFECKDHGRDLEVRLVDELIGRLSGGYGFNIKAYMVTRTGFQSGTLTTANNHGIGLIKLMPDDKIMFFSHFQTIDGIQQSRREFPHRARRALTTPSYVSDGERFYGVDDGYVFSTFNQMIVKHFETT
ncbi:hypothetical protein [Acetobacter sicerae]|uniref:hypothetical protein n=1 Tax=Acetobacter sicerae TaxID=85325 RepID=UPI00156ABCF2|nr:hypothetical protein [Acetobacter sicerae]NHN90359.1 hypothetical protein [Acetobacter sicerae]